MCEPFEKGQMSSREAKLYYQAGKDSTDDSQRFEAFDLTPVDGKQYIDVMVTIDSYTPFEAHVISLLKSIDSRLKRIQEALNQK